MNRILQQAPLSSTADYSLQTLCTSSSQWLPLAAAGTTGVLERPSKLADLHKSLDFSESKHHSGRSSNEYILFGGLLQRSFLNEPEGRSFFGNEALESPGSTMATAVLEGLPEGEHLPFEFKGSHQVKVVDYPSSFDQHPASDPEGAPFSQLGLQPKAGPPALPTAMPPRATTEASYCMESDNYLQFNQSPSTLPQTAKERAGQPSVSFPQVSWHSKTIQKKEVLRSYYASKSTKVKALCHCLGRMRNEPVSFQQKQRVKALLSQKHMNKGSMGLQRVEPNLWNASRPMDISSFLRISLDERPEEEGIMQKSPQTRSESQPLQFSNDDENNTNFEDSNDQLSTLSEQDYKQFTIMNPMTVWTNRDKPVASIDTQHVGVSKVPGEGKTGILPLQLRSDKKVIKISPKASSSEFEEDHSKNPGTVLAAQKEDGQVEESRASAGGDCTTQMKLKRSMTLMEKYNELAREEEEDLRLAHEMPFSGGPECQRRRIQNNFTAKKSRFRAQFNQHLINEQKDFAVQRLEKLMAKVFSIAKAKGLDLAQVKKDIADKVKCGSTDTASVASTEAYDIIRLDTESIIAQFPLKKFQYKLRGGLVDAIEDPAVHYGRPKGGRNRKLNPEASSTLQADQ